MASLRPLGVQLQEPFYGSTDQNPVVYSTLTVVVPKEAGLWSRESASPRHPCNPLNGEGRNINTTSNGEMKTSRRSSLEECCICLEMTASGSITHVENLWALSIGLYQRLGCMRVTRCARVKQHKFTSRMPQRSAYRLSGRVSVCKREGQGRHTFLGGKTTIKLFGLFMDYRKRE